MSQQNPPQWLLISSLPLLATMIDALLESVRRNYFYLKVASHRPLLLDDSTVNGVIKIYTQQESDLWLYEEQLARWQNEALNPNQRSEVKRLTSQLGQLRETLGAILSLADELKTGAIELPITPSDADSSLDHLSGRRGL